MVLELRRDGNSHSKRGREADAECPVCFNPLPRRERAGGRSGGSGGNGRTERSRVAFPCGHVVCSTCDSEMARRNFHSCPTCRTPRAGYSQSDVDLASRVRVMADRVAEEGYGDGAAGVETRFGQHPTIFHALVEQRAQAARDRGGGWTVMFFQDQSQGDPFDALLAEVPFPNRRRRVYGRHRTEVDRSDSPRTIRVQGRRGGCSPPPPEDESGEEEGDETTGPSPGRPGAQVFLDPDMSDLIENYLLQPVDLPTFLARHATVASTTRS